MKRFKSVWPVLIITVLVITLMLGSFNSFVSAYDAQDYSPAAFFSGKIEKSVKLTETFNVPDVIDNDVSVVVKAPDRTIVAQKETSADPNIQEVEAMQLGNYIVTYSKGKNSYSYNVYCYQEKEYFINVKATEKDFIPGYRRAANSEAGKGSEEDGVIKLPYFELAYKNDKGDIIPADNAEYRIRYANGAASIRQRPDVVNVSTAANEGTRELYNLAEGILKITLEARIGSATQKWYTKEYTVNVQKDFENEGEPSISVSNFSSNGNINTLYTLPVATAKDTFDNNVFVKVSVIGPDANPVKHYEADENGYADLSTAGEEIVFDNKDTRSFYLTQEGTYKITYVAINGSGTPSLVQTYSIKDVADKLAPVIKDIEETQIPNRWGIESVYMGKKIGDNQYEKENRPNGTKFVMPFPVAVDNYSKTEDLSLTVTLRNPESREIATWTGKVSAFEDGVEISESNKQYFKEANLDDLKFTDSGLEFSFDWIDFTNSKISKDADRLGDWTLTYSVRDEANLGGSGNARRAYTINVEQNFIDKEPPSVSQEKFENSIPKYIMVSEGGESFTIPSVAVSDDFATSRIKTVYTIESQISTQPSGTITIDSQEHTLIKSHDVKGGEEYKVIEHTDNKYYVIINKDNKFFAMPLSDEEISRISISYYAVDNVGNQSETLTGEFKIIYAGNVNANHELKADFTRIEDALTHFATLDFEASRKDASGRLESIKLGGFDLDADDISDATPVANTGFPDKDYTGFELSILDQDDNHQEFSSYAYFTRVQKSDPTDEDEVQLYRLHARNIEFTPAYGGEYRLNIRLFDISGKSQVYGFPFFVEGPTNGSGTVENASKISSTGQTNVSYELESRYTITPAGRYHDTINEGQPDEMVVDNGVIVRFIKGRSYSLAGNEFTALNASTYNITDYTYNHTWIMDEANGFEVDFADMIDPLEKHHQKKYEAFSAKNPSLKPEINFAEPIAPYSEKKPTPADPSIYTEEEYITLPVITAYTKLGNADIKVVVYFDGGDVNAKEVYSYQDGTDTIYTFDKTRTIEGQGGQPDEILDNQPTGRWAFSTAKDGSYTINIDATMTKSNVEPATMSVTMRVGNTSLPTLKVSEASRQTTAKVGDKFRMGIPEFADNDWDSVSIKLLDSNGTEISDPLSKLTLSSPTALKNHTEWTTEYEFEKAGKYTVVIVAKNARGDSKTVSYNLTVAEKAPDKSGPGTVLTWVLIVVSILILAGVIVYVIRFKPVKKIK